MKLVIEQHQPMAIVKMHGPSLEARNTKEFRRALDPILAKFDVILLDMEEVTFVDSSGLGSLLSSLRTLTERGGELKLCSLQPPVRTLFELVRMHRMFDIYNNRDESLQAQTVPQVAAQSA